MSQENLNKRIGVLCKALNDAGIPDADRARHFKDGKIHQWKQSGEPLADFGGGISCDPKAFDYLKKNGFIDIGMCWECGKEPIDKSYKFTSGTDPSIQYHICKSCHGGGVQFQKAFGVEKSSSNSNCYVATMCYEDNNAAEVKLLREYRDTILLESWIGRIFVKAYYQTAPWFVRVMKDQTAVNHLIRKYVLDVIVSRVRRILY